MTGKIDSFRFSFCQIRLENMCADGDLGYTDCFSRAGWSAPLAWQRSCRLLCHRSTVARPHGNDAPSLSRWRPAVAAEFGSARETETVLMGARFPCSRGFWRSPKLALWRAFLDCSSQQRCEFTRTFSAEGVYNLILLFVLSSGNAADAI